MHCDEYDRSSSPGSEESDEEQEKEWNIPSQHTVSDAEETESPSQYRAERSKEMMRKVMMRLTLLN